MGLDAMRCLAGLHPQAGWVAWLIFVALVAVLLLLGALIRD